jgi:D-cysteine desulfhydrase
MEQLSARVGAEVWVKRDGLTHSVYGGNKVRKFEFVFGDLLQKGVRAVLTGGGLGSHHTLATAVLARQFGLQAVCAYYCQPLDEAVCRNLRLSVPLGIDAHFCGDYVGLAVSFVWQYLRWWVRTRRPPYFVYPGAPGTLGTLGYVNAAFEMKDQWRAMEQREPEAVFVAVGSCGTFAGLLLGARLAGIGSRIVGVRVIEEDVANRTKIARMVNRAARYLRQRDPAVPQIEIEPQEVDLVDDYLGPGYAHPTEEGRQAVALAARTEELPLETTYTGKAMAALLDHAGRHPGTRLLLVDTYAEAVRLEEGDYRSLPERFWPVFDPANRARCWCLRAWWEPGFCPKGSRS